MFDISFSELIVIAIVALVVIGPEKLPKVARTAGAFFGRVQRFVTQVKDEVNREARFAELQKLQQEVQSSLQQGYDDIKQSILPEQPVIAEPEDNIKVEQPRKRTTRTKAATDPVEKKPVRRKRSKKDAEVVQTDMWQADQAEISDSSVIDPPPKSRNTGKTSRKKTDDAK